MKESRVLEVRISASGVFSHAQRTTIDTIVNSPNPSPHDAGRAVTGANRML